MNTEMGLTGKALADAMIAKVRAKHGITKRTRRVLTEHIITKDVGRAPNGEWWKLAALFDERHCRALMGDAAYREWFIAQDLLRHLPARTNQPDYRAVSLAICAKIAELINPEAIRPVPAPAPLEEPELIGYVVALDEVPELPSDWPEREEVWYE